MTVSKTKILQETDLSNNKESLIVSADEIEGRPNFPLDMHSLADQSQHILKSFKLWIDYSNTQQILSLKY